MKLSLLWRAAGFSQRQAEILDEKGFVMIRQGEDRDREAVFKMARILVVSQPLDLEAFNKQWPAILANPSVYFRVFEEEGQLLGYCLGHLHSTFYANGPVAWLEEMYIDEKHRLRGLGRQMVEAFEIWAASKDSSLAAMATRRAWEFYMACGYVESARYFNKPI